MSDVIPFTADIAWIRYVYLNRAWWAQRHDDRRPWEPKKPAGWRCFSGHDADWLEVDALSVALDNAVARTTRPPSQPAWLDRGGV